MQTTPNAFLAVGLILSAPIVWSRRDLPGDAMYRLLRELFERPQPFSVDTVEALWTDDHVSARMLECHLDPTSDLASRRPEAIDKIVGWMDARIGLSGKSVCDLGCGPGLYAERMAALGARVTGIDFSHRSLAHASRSAAAKGLEVDYRHGDYLKSDLPKEMDVVSLIYGDFCVLSPAKRRDLLARIHAMLKPGGRFVFDLFSRDQFEKLAEGVRFERRLMNGFWAAGDYFGFAATLLYPEQHVALDRYLILEPKRRRDIYNWMQYFTPDEIVAELDEARFAAKEITDLATGEQWAPAAAPFGVLAERKI